MTDLVCCFSITALSQRVIWTLIKAVLKIPESVQTFMDGTEQARKMKMLKMSVQDGPRLKKKWGRKRLADGAHIAKVDMNQDTEEQGQSSANWETDKFIHSVNIFIVT